MYGASKSYFTWMVIAVAVGILIATAGAAVVVPLFPTEGATVRETVRIAVADSDVPLGGFVVFNIDGEFRAAVGYPKEMGKDKKAFIYDWDTKALIARKGASEPDRVADGRHEIEIVVHSDAGTIKDQATISVKVANKIPTTVPPAPMKLAYKFFIGQQMTFDISAKVELLDIGGRPMLDDPVILTSASQVGISVEDLMGSSGLVRYKWYPMVSIQYLGQPYPDPVYVPTPTYRYISSAGRVTEAGFGVRSKIPLFDLFVQIPAGLSRPGDSWSATNTLNVPGVFRSVPVDLKSAFDSLEWESGHECAKIKTNLSSRFALPIIKDRLELPESDVTGTGTAYFAYKSGKLLNVDYIFEAQTQVDDSVLESLRGGQAGDVGNLILPSTGSSSQPESYPESYSNPRPSYGGSRVSYSMPMPFPQAPSGGGYGPTYGGRPTQPATTQTPVKFRITVRIELKK